MQETYSIAPTYEEVPMTCQGCGVTYSRLSAEYLRCSECHPEGRGMVLDSIRGLLAEVLADEQENLYDSSMRENLWIMDSVDKFICATAKEVESLCNLVLIDFHDTHAKFLKDFLGLRGYTYSGIYEDFVYYPHLAERQIVKAREKYNLPQLVDA